MLSINSAVVRAENLSFIQFLNLKEGAEKDSS